MQSGGIRTTIFQIGLVSRPWRRASMQVATAISAREVSIPAINPHWRTSLTPGTSFKPASAELRYRIFGSRASKTRLIFKNLQAGFGRSATQGIFRVAMAVGERFTVGDRAVERRNSFSEITVIASG